MASHNRLHELIARAAPLRDVLTELVEGIEEYEPSVLACLVLLDRDTSTLHPGAGPSLPSHWLEAIDGVVIGPNIGSCGSAAWSGELAISADMSTDPKWAPIRDFAASCNLRHCWSMPIKGADGLVLGTFALYGSQPRSPQPEHITLMQDGARLGGIAIERHRTMERLIQDARYDGLTGLPSRRAIFERLEQALSRAGASSKVATLFVDLDGLKALNDRLGHDRADDMIREVAQRLRPVLRADDFVGRFGGDEFIAVAEQIGDPDQAAALAAHDVPRQERRARSLRLLRSHRRGAARAPARRDHPRAAPGRDPPRAEAGLPAGVRSPHRRGRRRRGASRWTGGRSSSPSTCPGTSWPGPVSRSRSTRRWPTPASRRTCSPSR